MRWILRVEISKRSSFCEEHFKSFTSGKQRVVGSSVMYEFYGPAHSVNPDLVAGGLGYILTKK